MVSALLVALGGALGASLRYLVDRAVAARTGALVPLGTFIVNVTGSYVFGLLGGAASVSPAAMAMVGTGVCGAFTTYSTFGYETVRLFEAKQPWLAAVNVVASVCAGIGAAFAGWWTAGLL